MNLFTYSDYDLKLKAAFIGDRRIFPHRSRLIAKCESEIYKMFDDCIFKESNILNHYGPEKDLCFLYSDQDLYVLIEKWLLAIRASNPSRYRLCLVSVAAFLSFMNLNSWFSDESLVLFFSSFDEPRITNLLIYNKQPLKLRTYHISISSPL